MPHSGARSRTGLTPGLPRLSVLTRGAEGKVSQESGTFTCFLPSSPVSSIHPFGQVLLPPPHPQWLRTASLSSSTELGSIGQCPHQPDLPLGSRPAGSPGGAVEARRAPLTVRQQHTKPGPRSPLTLAGRHPSGLRDVASQTTDNLLGSALMTSLCLSGPWCSSVRQKG